MRRSHSDLPPSEGFRLSSRPTGPATMTAESAARQASPRRPGGHPRAVTVAGTVTVRVTGPVTEYRRGDRTVTTTTGPPGGLTVSCTRPLALSDWPGPGTRGRPLPGRVA